MEASRPIREITVVGLGTMGCGIAEAALIHGFGLRVVDGGAAEAAEGILRIRERITRHVRDNLVPAGLLDAIDNIPAATGLADACGGVELVIGADSRHEQILVPHRKAGGTRP